MLPLVGMQDKTFFLTILKFFFFLLAFWMGAQGVLQVQSLVVKKTPKKTECAYLG